MRKMPARTRRAALAVAALLFTACVRAADAGAPPPGGSIAYVLTNMSWALQTSAEGSECPQGMNDGNREQFKKLFPDDGSKRTLESTQLRREIEGFHPTTAPDPLPFLEGQGPVAPGLDLDGVAGSEDFLSPTGQAGIDNQMYRVLGCIANYRGPDGALRFFEDEMVLRENYNRVLVELRGVDSLVEDPAVEVSIYRGRDPVIVDAGGLKALPGGTQRVDLRWGARYVRQTTGRIADGVLLTEPVDLLYPWNVFWLPTDQYMYAARLQLALTPTEASGLIGGYVDIETWYLHMVRNWSTHHQSYGKSSAPSIYKAMRRLADAEPDPLSGENRALSGALAVRFTQVMLIAPPAGELAAALQNRHTGVPYRGPAVARPVEEEVAEAASPGSSVASNEGR